MGTRTIKIDQLIFIHNLVEEEIMQDYNLISISMKVGNFIKMQDKNEYKEIYLKVYQQLIGKPIYLSYKTRPDIFLIVE